jgi:sec-independent protein translocase protein TatA
MIASSYLMQAFGVGGLEWVFIIIIVVVLFFGVKKIPEIARSVGRASSEYQKAKIQAKQELNQMNAKDGVDKSTIDRDIDREKLESIADTLGIDSTNKNDAELREAIDLAISKERHKV